MSEHLIIVYQALESFRQASKSVSVGADVARYIQDIVIFLRLSRGVAGVISSKASKHFQQFARYFLHSPHHFQVTRL